MDLPSSMMKTILFFLSVTASACTESVPTPETVRSEPARCPLGIADARVRYEATAAGGALVFLTTPEHLDELRERAWYASASHGPERLGKGHHGKHGTGGRHGLQPMQLPPASAGVDEIDGGARISFTPADPNDTGVLRAKLEARARELMAGC